MKTKGWFGENITGLLAVICTIFVMFVDGAVLFRQIHTNDTTTATILSSIHGAWMVVLGYYFVSSKGKTLIDPSLNKPTEENKPPV